MTMDIQCYSKLSVSETARVIADPIEKLKVKFGTRFWFSEVKESSPLSKQILSEDFGFHQVCGFTVSDTTKDFDGLDEVARTLRRAIKNRNAVVLYADTGELFPKEDYASQP